MSVGGRYVGMSVCVSVSPELWPLRKPNVSMLASTIGAPYGQKLERFFQE